MENKIIKDELNLDLINSLNPAQKLELEARLIGYQKMPPSIEEFINDPYYMGSIYGNNKLYPYWIPILKKIYPSPIHTAYNNIVLTGCLGSGKSTVARLMAAYMKCRLDHMKNFDFFALSSGKGLVMSYFHTTGDLADNTFTSPLRDLKTTIPYFREGMLNDHMIVDMTDSPRGRGPLGTDCIFYVFSEINFIKPQVAKLKLDTAFNRMASRFKKVHNYFGHIILDSSASQGGSFVDEFVEKHSDPETTLTVRSKIWEVKSQQGIYGNSTSKTFATDMELKFHLYEGGELFLEDKWVRDVKHLPKNLEYPIRVKTTDGWFKVYLGDAIRDAFIIDSKTDLKGLDKDRIMEAPMELRTEFNLNLELSLQDHAGISTKSSNVFIADRNSIPLTFTLPMRTPEIIEIDFYDRNDSIMKHIKEAIKFIPRDKVLSVRFDIGVVNDYTGLAISHFDEWDVIDKKNKTLVPKFTTPVALAVGRKQGQETSIRLFYEFIKDLSKEFEIGAVTADSYQSRQLLQDLERDGFNAFMLSVDRTDESYQYAKLAMYENRVNCSQSKLLQREVRELIYVDNKVDHPAVTRSDNLTYGKGSKDVADAWVGSLLAMSFNLEYFTFISKLYNRASYLESMKKRTVTNKQNILKDAKVMMRTGGTNRFMKKELERREILSGVENLKLATEKSHRNYKSQYLRMDAPSKNPLKDSLRDAIEDGYEVVNDRDE